MQDRPPHSPIDRGDPIQHIIQQNTKQFLPRLGRTPHGLAVILWTQSNMQGWK